MRCDTIAAGDRLTNPCHSFLNLFNLILSGVISAAKNLNLKVPVVVRLQGTRLHCLHLELCLKFEISFLILLELETLSFFL